MWAQVENALYYCLQACPVNKSQIRSLECVLNNTFRNIFATKSYDVAIDCVYILAIYVVQENSVGEQEVKVI